jgi:hypothetical protein
MRLAAATQQSALPDKDTDSAADLALLLNVTEQYVAGLPGGADPEKLLLKVRESL